MTNKELIELLSKFDPDIEVCYLDERWVTEIHGVDIVNATNANDWSDWEEDEGGNILLIRQMKIFFDTEFYEDGKTIELISIGLVREDGATYYAESIEGYPFWFVDHWVADNVVPHLKASKATEYVPEYKIRSRIAKEILEFVGEKPEFWAYYADYDWVALCQLYGRMIDLPKGWPMFCRDLKQLHDSSWNFTLPKQSTIEHNALNDALWCKQAFEFLEREQAKVW